MARGRLISRTLGTSSKKYARLRAEYPAGAGWLAQVLFPLLVAAADDFGRLPGDAFSVKHSVFSTAPEPEADFDAALEALAEVELVRRYVVDGAIYLEIVQFERHQSGLHKRTTSAFPADSGVRVAVARAAGNFPPVPEVPGDSGNSRLREQNRREQKGTEQKRTEAEAEESRRRTPAAAAAPAAPRPQAFGRVHLHRWQLEELINRLGPHAAAFGLDGWLFELAGSASVLPAGRALWPWVLERFEAEVRARGLPLAEAAPAVSKRDAQIAATLAAFKGR